MSKTLGQLLASLNECRVPQDYADRAIELIGNPIVIFDVNMRVLGISECEQADANFQNLRRERYPAESMTSDLSWRQRMRELLEQEDIVNEKVFGVRHLTKVLRLGGNTIGQIDAGVFIREFTETDIEIFSLLCMHCAVTIYNNQPPQYIRRDRLDYLLEYLLDGHKIPEEGVRLQMDMCRWQPGQRLYVLVADAFSGGAYWNELPLEELAGARDRAIRYKQFQVVVLSRDKGMDASDQEWLQRILTASSMHYGISRCFGQVSEIQSFFRQAAAALDIGRRIDPEKRLFTYDDYSEYHMIHEMAERDDVLNYVIPELMELAKMEAARKSGVMHTLLCWLLYGRSVQAAANELHLHKNTVSYRVSKALESLGMDATDGRQMGRLLHSMRILEYVDKNKYYPDY